MLTTPFLERIRPRLLDEKSRADKQTSTGLYIQDLNEAFGHRNIFSSGISIWEHTYSPLPSHAPPPPIFILSISLSASVSASCLANRIRSSSRSRFTSSTTSSSSWIRSIFFCRYFLAATLFRCRLTTVSGSGDAERRAASEAGGRPRLGFFGSVRPG